MPRWLSEVLGRIGQLAAARRVRFTHKAFEEIAAVELELDEEDACDILASLERRESAGRRLSERTGEWLYVFKPSRGGVQLYVKLILRGDCVVVSFHEDERDG